MQIQVIAVTLETKPTAKGSYQIADVAYQDLSNGKIAGKKVMSFGPGANAFNVLKSGAEGKTFDVTQVKSEPNAQGKQFWNWTALTPSNGAGPTATSTPSVASTSTAVRSNYETPDERANRQVLIVRQSSLTNAINTLNVGAKVVKKEEIFALAQEYVDFVFDNAVKQKEKEEAKKTGTGFDDMPDDIPY